MSFNVERGCTELQDVDIEASVGPKPKQKILGKQSSRQLEANVILALVR